MKIDGSRHLFSEAQRYLPGGVDSPVRAFRAVGGEPLFLRCGSGAHIWDVDGNEFIDYVCSWGPLILGHAHPRVVTALKAAVESGTSFGAPVEGELALAKLMTEAFPSIEMVRFVNSGTEATMSALRLARAFSGRDKIIKFAGCYHGHADGLLVRAGSGALTLGVPDSPGVPVAVAQNTISAPYNDFDSVQRIFEKHGPDIAAVIVEPIAGNMGVVPPQPGFLKGLREVTTAYRSLLIFDEVISGFRVAYGGAQSLYGIYADLTCLGKIIGGGLPVGAYGGRREMMELVAPSGPVYQAGTLSGNPLAMTAGIETLRILKEPGVYPQLEERASRLAEGLEEAVREAGISAFLTRVGSMLTLFFTSQCVVDYETAKTADTRRYASFFRGMLEHGINLAPSQFEAVFISLAHSEADIEATIRAAKETCQTLNT
ncbi:MAG: glutamate-1-semialdehyde 2,1-aminomutase [Chloroflexi bacterium]|nr:glutamate-1-semialdehyde 2,1-aminomutase [Chloroflexota bacterium]MCL5075362.1 glutamate-1-semialdehyde 2,1-aminomutase [Chloroflexota bacterium]